MSRAYELTPVFTTEIPRELQPGKLYISIEYTMVSHLCACGCGREVVTPLHPARWALTYNGQHVSMWPSIGNWHSPCRSHYVIERNRVVWAGLWSRERVRAARTRDRAALEDFYEETHSPQASASPAHSDWPKERRSLRRLLRRAR